MKHIHLKIEGQDPFTAPAAAHTPGPWEFLIGSYGPYISTQALSHDGICRDTIAKLHYSMTGDRIDEAQTHANARLISAAPNMLAAAKSMVGSAVDCGTYYKVDADDIAAFVAAIAKAEGRT